MKTVFGSVAIVVAIAWACQLQPMPRDASRGPWWEAPPDIMRVTTALLGAAAGCIIGRLHEASEGPAKSVFAAAPGGGFDEVAAVGVELSGRMSGKRSAGGPRRNSPCEMHDD